MSMSKPDESKTRFEVSSKARSTFLMLSKLPVLREPFKRMFPMRNSLFQRQLDFIASALFQLIVRDSIDVLS